MANSTETTEETNTSPDDLIYMHHPKTGGVKTIRRVALGVWSKKGWKEGAGPAADVLPETATELGVRAQFDPEGKDQPVAVAAVGQASTPDATAPVTDAEATTAPEADAAKADAPVTNTPATDAKSAAARTSKGTTSS